ncbi:hypothetical protein [Haloarcula nitratireducens]|uniref:XRE family transcriptional regulator n=1 Tax=Haloarcula nitratireducens TaxID=2487749 RepID=A0AAW4PJP0_9EURY|nr:hypothetical protein [Halomicroarcula nitratireducens]MBX0297868.1 hypothetical protein [Halomicroarcula nitratireducens]
MNDPTDKDALIESFAGTYNSSSTASSWELVQQYQRVLEYTSKNPNKGSSAVASALNLPRSRIRSWVDGDGRPDAVRGIQRAESHGLLDLSWEGQTLRSLTTLVAWIFSGGSINEVYVPSFALSGGDRDIVESALEDLGAGWTEFNAGESDRVTELRPTEDASVLGRLLLTLGAPLGAKNRETDLQLPRYLHDAPEELRLLFARTYIGNRATDRADRPKTPIQLAEKRSPVFREELRSFFESLVGEGEVRGEAESYRLSAEAVDKLALKPVVISSSRVDG